jgi:hypothetical protein
VYWRGLILSAIYRCVLLGIEETWLFNVLRCVTTCWLSERRNWEQSSGLPSLSDRGDVRILLRQAELTVKLLTNRTRACTLDDFFNLNC